MLFRSASGMKLNSSTATAPGNTGATVTGDILLNFGADGTNITYDSYVYALVVFNKPLNGSADETALMAYF